MKNVKMTKAALCISLLLLTLWFALGTASSMAWFKDEATLVNALYFGVMDIKMYHKVSDHYEPVDESTRLFDDNALYEPGYTRISYLKIENNGSIPFSYDLSVVPDLSSIVLGTSVLGNKINLADCIKFGLITGTTEEEVIQKTSNRNAAKIHAVNPLSHYSQNGGILSPGSVAYAAIILYFPEDVGNVMNYRGEPAPEITLGIAAVANQIIN